ncbi:MAG: polymer-forming cytoskeletal protein [Gammaproteobacteria bacterium]|nr:polymer-forming cytoskeletal protein [Gammaproteobacteria bacterium]
MFERGKKDKDALDSLDMESERTPGDWQPTSNAPAAKNPDRAEVAVIGRSIRIDGDLRGEEDLRIEGDVNGTIQLRNNTLTIGSEGKIGATVYAKSVTVHGSMQGDVVGSESVSVRKNARVNGNITAPRVSLEDGAKFKGSIEMDPAAVEKALGLQSGGNKGQEAMDAKARIASRSNSDSRSKPETAPVKNKAKNEVLR